MAVLNRSETELKKLIEKGSNPDGNVQETSNYENSNASYPTPLECAVLSQWTTGIDILLGAGADGFYALDAASTRSEPDIFDIIMKQNCSLFPPNFLFNPLPTFWPWGWFTRFGGFYRTNNIRFASRIAEELQIRRKRLRELGQIHLKIEPQYNTATNEDFQIDVGAANLFFLLKRNGVDMPRSLFPGLQHTMYHIPWISVAVADQLYTHGFLNIDEPNSDGLTPFQFHGWTAWQSNDNFELYYWFLEKGASPYFKNLKYPSILFYVAQRVTWLETPDLHYLKGISRHVDACLTDNCKCFCSSSGCLPVPKRFIRPWKFGERDIYVKWFKACGLELDQLELYCQEVCRLEIFERLEMAHTCHRRRLYPTSQLSKEDISEPSSTDEDDVSEPFHSTKADIREIQAEDEESHQQLKLILKAYSEHRRRFLGTIFEFWDEWWLHIDRILPQSSVVNTFPAEYVGLDFIDIIRLELFRPQDLAPAPVSGYQELTKRDNTGNH
jgi:hypothetical protein